MNIPHTNSETPKKTRRLNLSPKRQSMGRETLLGPEGSYFSPKHNTNPLLSPDNQRFILLNNRISDWDDSKQISRKDDLKKYNSTLRDRKYAQESNNNKMRIDDEFGGINYITKKKVQIIDMRNVRRIIL